MSEFALTDARVMLPDGLREGLAVWVREGRIAALVPPAELAPGVPTVSLGGGMLLPGFIDVQVNGGGGVLFNETTGADAIAAIGAAHRAFGTTGFMPTLISDDLATIREGMEGVGAAIAAGVPGVLGIHIEGPFLNAERRGIHDAARLRKLDAEALELLTSIDCGRKLVTLAPDMVSDAAIRELAGAGVIVSAGHTNASYRRANEAFAAGVTGVTHLFNAMSPLTTREPGMVGAALAGEAWCGIIVDGLHVDPAVFRIALAARNFERFMLVTDAMSCVGTGATGFELFGRPITVRGSACYDAEGRLAGSNLDMAMALRNAVNMLGLDLATASRFASANPADFLGLGHECGRIAPGQRADLVWLDERLEVLETWIGGVPAAGQGAAPRASHG